MNRFSVFDFSILQAAGSNCVVALTPIEYNLLYHLATNAGRVMPHETRLAKVWGAEYRNESHYLKV